MRRDLSTPTRMSTPAAVYLVQQLMSLCLR